MKIQPIIGLFGTCGTSRWREPFLAAYERASLRAFNPQVPEWTPACAAAENENFAHNAILLHVVTAETTAFGSLAEIGLAIAEIERSNRDARPEHARHLLIFIDPACRDPKANETQIRDSERTRKLVASKLPSFASQHIQLCGSLEEMLRLSLELAHAHPLFRSARDSSGVSEIPSQ